LDFPFDCLTFCLIQVLEIHASKTFFARQKLPGVPEGFFLA
jgi:hypothetical protein